MADDMPWTKWEDDKKEKLKNPVKNTGKIISGVLHILEKGK